MDPTADRLRRPYRWVILTVYTLVAGVSQMLWLNFAPLLTQIQERYGVSEFQASTLVLVFPLLNVLLSLPAGLLIDTRGYVRMIGAGAAMMGLFSTLRIYDQSFYALLVGQIGIAVAQPLVVNGISKLISDWFTEEQGALATGLGTVGMFIGMAVGMAASPALAAALGLRGAMMVFAAITGVLAGGFLLLARHNTPAAAAGSADVSGRAMAVLRVLLRSRDLVLVFTMCFLGLGFFNGLTTWIEPILGRNGIGAVDAGMVGALLILGGIGGAATIPALSDRFRRRRPFVILCAAGGLATLYPLCTLSSYPALLGLAGALGFLFLPAYPLLLEMSAELAGPELAGSATGVLMLTGNAGGVITIVLMQIVKGDGPSWMPAVLLMMGLLLGALVLALIVSETFHARSGG